MRLIGNSCGVSMGMVFGPNLVKKKKKKEDRFKAVKLGAS